MCLAVPGRIEEIEDHDELLRSARVDFSGIKRNVNLVYTPEAREGQYVLVHVGFAISVIDEDEAKETLDALRELRAMEEEFGEGDETPR